MKGVKAKNKDTKVKNSTFISIATGAVAGLINGLVGGGGGSYIRDAHFAGAVEW